MEMLLCENDGAFGPAVRGCRGNFDFTRKFEAIVFSILPSACYVVLAGMRLTYISRHPHITDNYLLRTIKAVSSLNKYNNYVT